METKQPSEIQIKELWEWCGFTELHTGKEWNNLYWESPHKEWCYPVPPVIDLNNLFRYAVPKLIEELVWGKYVDLMKKWLDDILFEGKDPVLALFWAIDSIIDKGGEK